MARLNTLLLELEGKVDSNSSTPWPISGARCILHGCRRWLQVEMVNLVRNCCEVELHTIGFLVQCGLSGKLNKSDISPQYVCFKKYWLHLYYHSPLISVSLRQTCWLNISNVSLTTNQRRRGRIFIWSDIIQSCLWFRGTDWGINTNLMCTYNFIVQAKQENQHKLQTPDYALSSMSTLQCILKSRNYHTSSR